MAPRTDRTASSLRPLAISQSVLARVDGSTKFSFGNVSVLGSVTGPTEVRIAKELVDRATLEINVRPLRGLAGPASKAAETNLTSLLTPLILLHLYPRSLIQLTLQTLSTPTTAFSTAFSTGVSDLPATPAHRSNRPLGSTFAGAAESAARMNAAMLALVDAGVACRGMLVAVAVVFVAGEMRLDPTPKEEELATSKHVFAFSFGVGVGGVEGECVGVDSVGEFEEDELFDAQDNARTACQAILAFTRKSIEARYGATGAPPPAEVKPAPKRESSAEDDVKAESDEDMSDA